MKVLETALVSYYNSNMVYSPKPKLYNTKAPKRALFPYITFNQISGVPENALRRKKIESFLYQFNIFSAEESVVELNNIFEDLKTVFDNCTLIVVGYNFIDMDREISRKDEIEIKAQIIWKYTIQYRIKIND